MAKSRYFPSVNGSFQFTGHGGSVSTYTRSFPDSGEEAVTIDNTAGDHVTPNAFSLSRIMVTGGMVSGEKYNNTYRYYGYRSLTPYPSKIYDQRRRALPTMPPIPNGLANKLYANASPDRPDVLLPVFAFELRELPGLIRQLGLLNLYGRKHMKRAGKSASALWLSGNFGWAPLIADLKKLVLFADSMSRREREFDKLYSQNGLRRKVKLFSATGNQSSITMTVDAIDGFGNWYATGHPMVDVWGTVRYKPERLPDGSVLRRPTTKDIRRKILGLNAASVTLNIWEAIPWSWLVDYFIGVSDYLGAHPIGRSAVPSNGCIMTHKRCKWSAAVYQGSADIEGKRFTVSAGQILRETKQRTIANASPLPTVLMNPLSGHQLSILGSIAVLRSKSALARS